MSNSQSMTDRNVTTAAQHLSQEDVWPMGRDAHDVEEQPLSDGMQELHQKSTPREIQGDIKWRVVYDMQLNIDTSNQEFDVVRIKLFLISIASNHMIH